MCYTLYSLMEDTKMVKIKYIPEIHKYRVFFADRSHGWCSERAMEDLFPNRNWQVAKENPEQWFYIQSNIFLLPKARWRMSSGRFFYLWNPVLVIVLIVVIIFVGPPQGKDVLRRTRKKYRYFLRLRIFCLHCLGQCVILYVVIRGFSIFFWRADNGRERINPTLAMF